MILGSRSRGPERRNSANHVEPRTLTVSTPRSSAPGAVRRYIILAVACLVITTLTFGFLDHYVHANVLHILLKIVIDTAMYVVNYRIQRGWVFKNSETEAV